MCVQEGFSQALVQQKIASTAAGLWRHRDPFGFAAVEAASHIREVGGNSVPFLPEEELAVPFSMHWVRLEQVLVSPEDENCGTYLH